METRNKNAELSFIFAYGFYYSILFIVFAFLASGCSSLRSDAGRKATIVANRAANALQISMGIETGLINSDCGQYNPRSFITKQDGALFFDKTKFIEKCINTHARCNKTEPINAQKICSSVADSVDGMLADYYDDNFETGSLF